MSLQLPQKHLSEVIINDMSKMGIVIPEFSQNSTDDTILLNKLRKLVDMLTQAQSTYPAGMLSTITTSLLKIGACQELSQRFLLEWCLRSNSNCMVSIVFMSDNQNHFENHGCVLIGEVNCPEDLIVGKTNGKVMIAPNSAFVSIDNFFEKQNFSLIYADPLLGETDFVGWRNSNNHRFRDYCLKHQLTHVIGLRQYNVLLNRPDKHEFLRGILACAHNLASDVHQSFITNLLNHISTSVLSSEALDWKLNSNTNCFCLIAESKVQNDLLTFFSKKGFSTGKEGEIDIVRSQFNNNHILIFRNARQMSLSKIHDVFRTIMHNPITTDSKKSSLR